MDLRRTPPVGGRLSMGRCQRSAGRSTAPSAPGGACVGVEHPAVKSGCVRREPPSSYTRFGMGTGAARAAARAPGAGRQLEGRL
eukprot:5494633-Prymnesium_polylepis.1